MERMFSSNWAQPNLPLRRPTSRPGAAGVALLPGPANEAGAGPARPNIGQLGNGSMALPANRDALAMSGAALPALTVHFCNFCAKQGDFKCNRCMKVVYCSVKCQSEDWKAHRHLCNPNNLETIMEGSQEAFPNRNKTALVVEDMASLVRQKNGDASIERIIMKDLPASVNVKGAEIQGTVVEFYNPGRFFFLPQSPDISQALQNISAELQKTYSGSSETNHEPRVGEVCAVRFSLDLKWYRGLVQIFSPEKKIAKILYIDFGNEEDVPVNRIRPLAANIPKLGPCVMECYTARVMPMAETWSGEGCIAVSQMLGRKPVTVKMMDQQENEHVYAVDILLSMGMPLSTYLLDHGYAQQVTNTATQSQQGIDAIMNAALENFRSLSNGKDDNNWAQPPEPLTQTVGDHLSVVVTHFHSPNNFIVQKIKNAGVIQDLQLRLREHCSHVAAPQNFRPAPGTVCCAQFTEDKQWYRAKVLAYSSKDRVCVGYIDFGNSEEVDLGYLFPITSSLLALPAQAMPCGLAGVQPFGETWTNDCLLAMQQRVSNRILHIKIQGEEKGQALVVMVDEASDPHADVAELLISAGYAAPAIAHTQSDQRGKEMTTTPEKHNGVEYQGSEWSSEANLRFQSRVSGCQLPARVISINEEGYGVELENKEQNVAAALMSEKLAKDIGGMAKEMQGKPSPSAERVVCTEPKSHIQILQAGVTSNERPTQEQNAASCTGPSFSVDWKTVELPLNETFKPFVVGFVNPSLFYLACVSPANEEPLKQVMMALAAYCTNNHRFLSSATTNRPTPGAACCAQFSDNNWYRAVVLKTVENNVSVVYADYGNRETVPLTRVMPIPVHLLKLPFQICRCTLSDKEGFPTERPDDVQQMLMSGVLTTVQSFDGRANVLSLAVPAESGGPQVSAVTGDASHAHPKSNPQLDSTQKNDKPVSSTSIKVTTSPDRPQPNSIPNTLTGLENNIDGFTKPSQPSEPSFQTLQQRNTQAAAAVNSWSGSVALLANRDALAMSGAALQALTVHLCNFCARQGDFKCNRCMKVVYCSVKCQSEDWKAHRHLCNPNNMEATMELSLEAFPNRNKAALVVEDMASLVRQKNVDATIERVTMKDLPASVNVKGAEIQGTVVEFYNPGRFFFLPQSPDISQALQNISAELQKTYSGSSETNHEPRVGEVCAVRFSLDLKWYRGLVQIFSPEKKIAKILYIDFGNEEDVPVNRIRPLAANILKLGPCVMQCCTARVVPMAETWSGECCITLSQMLGRTPVTVKIMDQQENGHVYAVDILLSMGKQLSTYLLDHGYAQQVTDTATQSQQGIDAIMNAALENFRSLSNGKDDNNWAQPPEPLTQTVGDHLSVVVTHFDSPNNFIVQKVKNAGLIQDLQLKLREHCSHVAAPQNFRPAPGTVCCAQFTEDKQWYRAKVLAYSSKDRVCVGYIDFGNSEEVDLGYLFPITSSLLALPAQAMPCGLAGVQPFGQTWTNDCLLAMQQRVSNRILLIKIQGEDEGKALVMMVDESSDPQADVAELLISAGYAAPAIVHTQSDQRGKETTTTPEKHNVPAQELLVWPKVELPLDNQTVVLQTVFVESPKEFYCCISNPTDEKKRTELAAQLKLHCEADPSPFVPKVGEPCCAIFPGDGSCYRAMVQSLLEDKVSVSLVDYGHSVTIESSCLRSITPKLLKLPFQAIRCWLAGVEHQGSEWSSEARLRFQSQVNGCQLSARVISINEEGYGVELVNKEQNVAAALLSEKLAKDIGLMAKEMQDNPSPAAETVECTEPKSHIQTLQAGVPSNERPTQEQNAASCPGPSFSVDWKTVELPLNETFKPFVVGFVNPSLFYLSCVNPANEEPLKQVMMALAAYCTNNHRFLSSATTNRPTPGAACCAQFSDNNWYRAVVLEAGENNVSVVYADYGNRDTVPLTRVMPIPVHLLKLPFQICRCTLSGKEGFPTERPDDVQQMLMSGVLTTVQSFDGRANVLSLALPAESGGPQVSGVTGDASHAHIKSNPHLDATQKSDKPVSSTSIKATTSPDRPQPNSIPNTLTGLENTTDGFTKPSQPSEPSSHTLQQRNTQAAAVNSWSGPMKKTEMEVPSPSVSNPTGNVIDPQTTGCCCHSLKKKMESLEQLMNLHISLIKQLLGNTNNV
ncbi:tudor domain-containing protein 1 isoform X2 [Gouania willdenowi]|uniref:tudor domain-containing protein 1 isoform X2 n=1 Tax=Gouania willdenowi TaxID=441366 RepID=UPI0010543D6B|nr:tudor domain-containing protein 1 isoform X2 [Gouania willdenowi]